jgi:predicted ATPase/class 3 adenylate cyclase/DNA-binding CsgD family transcriptional regulator
VTLLLAIVEGSSLLWETQPDAMTAAVALLDRTLTKSVAARHGVRPAEQGEDDGFVIAFARASDAVACALELQRAPLAPIRLRIGVHTGELQMCDEGSYVGPPVNRTARLRDLGHGGQILISGTTEDLVADQLPADVWLADLGAHHLHGMARPERVVQLCHPDLHNEFPPLVPPKATAVQRLPLQLTSFIGRTIQIVELRELLPGNRLVTLTGAGGVGKTRLAIQLAAETADTFGGVWYVDLAQIADPDVVPVAVARAMALPDQPGRSTVDVLAGFIGDRQMLVVLDNCEHLLDASAALVVALLSACPRLTMLATSREPIGVPGEVTWRVPSLSLADEAIELFTDRAHRARPDFSVSADDTTAVTEICGRLDGIPLAIELAAARVRSLSPTEIRDSLHDRFRLLTGGARTAMRRQQTLRASVDWSHALLTESECVVFRRLAVFMGGFDLPAAQAVCGTCDMARQQVLDQLSLLVDKSLVSAENRPSRTRYRLLETVRQYAQEKLDESGEADAVRAQHRDHYTAMAALLDTPAHGGHEGRIEEAETEIANLRAAFAWSYENSDIDLALGLASSLQPLWLARGRIQEGLAWFDAALTDDIARRQEIAPAVRGRALADKAVLSASVSVIDAMSQAEQALVIARELDDPTLLARALTACGCVNPFNTQAARPYLTEAIGLARILGDDWSLSQILGWQAYVAFIAGEPVAGRVASEEGRDLADAIGNRFHSRHCRWCLGMAQMIGGDLVAAIAQLDEVATEAEADHDVLWRVVSLLSKGRALAYHGDTSGARTAANTAIEAAAELGGSMEGLTHALLAFAALAAGDVAAAQAESDRAWQRLSVQRDLAAINVIPVAEIALARNDLVEARRRADDFVAATTGWHLAKALTTRARVAIAQDESEQAERDAHDALACAASVEAYQPLADIQECLAGLHAEARSHCEAARLFGAAETTRGRTGAARFKIYDAGYHETVAELRDAMGNQDFESAWAEGAALSTEEAIAYAQRGRGERKRPTSGWESLTPTERDVIRLLSEGLANKDIATRLFVSPRTVQTHLRHVYTKLALTSRVQLVQEAARHT